MESIYNRCEPRFINVRICQGLASGLVIRVPVSCIQAPGPESQFLFRPQPPANSDLQPS